VNTRPHDQELFDRKKFAANPAYYNRGKDDTNRDPLNISPKMRRAKCCMCSNTMISGERAPMLERNPGETFDTYYCGCYGWD